MAVALRSFRALCARSLSTTSTPSPTSTSLPSAVALLKSQPSHYIVASLHERRYLLTPRDLLTVPRLKGVSVGDVIRLSKIHELGSRDFTLRGDPTIPSETVNVCATVVEHTKGPMEVIHKKKRRKGYQKHIRHKQGYTRLRIGAIDIVDQKSSMLLPLPEHPEAQQYPISV
ncbi:ribosomal protein L21-like protein [Hysterangium stoloniferum]|nr:ribosomal protein L21-like protein [Hysterangium stoloniferum]